MLICCLFLVPSIAVFAEVGVPEIEEQLYRDADQIRYVEDIDEYLAQLNAGLITPTNTTVSTVVSANSG